MRAAGGNPGCPNGYSGLPDRPPGTACGSRGGHANIPACDWAFRRTVPDRADLVTRDEHEALRRLPGTVGLAVVAPVADDASAAVRPLQAGPGSARSRPGAFPREMGPTAFMAMQRFAGNRAMVQALGRSQAPGLLESLAPDLGEEAAPGGAPPAEALSLPGQAGAAPGDSGDGGPNGFGTSGDGAGTSGGGAANGGAASGATEVTRASSEPTGSLAGGAANGGAAKAGAATVGAGGNGAGSKASGSAAARGSAASRAAHAAARGSDSGGAAKAATDGAGAGGAAKAAGGAGAAGAVTGGATTGTTHSRRSAPPPIIATGGGPTGSTAGSPTTRAKSSPLPDGAGPGPGAGGIGSPVVPGPGPEVSGAAGGGGTAGVAAADTAKTGIDWNEMLSEFGPPARTILEVGRLIPGWGLVAGFASDSLSFASDISSIPTSKNAALTTGLVIFRNVVNILNNGLGHVLYVDQLIQDGLAGSVVGAEFTPFTAATNELLAGIKVALDEVQMGTDILVEVEALYEANHAPDSAEAEKWRSLADGYAANILGDVVNTILDLISLSSAGAANTAPVEEAKLPLTLAGAFLEHAAPNIIGAINNVLGVWLGGLVTKGRTAATGAPAAGGAGTGTSPATGGGPAPAPGGVGAGAQPAVQRIGGLSGGGDGRGAQAASLRDQALVLDIAGGFIDVEAPQARATYDGINVVIESFEAYANDQIAQIDAVVGALSGGKSAFQVIRDAVKAGLDDMNGKLAMAQQLGDGATNAKANAASISAACTAVLSGIDSLVMPDVQIPSVDLGDGVVADAAAAVANTAAEAANAAIELAISGVSTALDTAKDSVRGPVQELKEHADGLGEWLAILATKCTEMVGTLHAQIASFSEGLGHCNNIEDVINLIIGQVSDLTGMPKVTVQDLRNTWNSVGPYIDQFAALGPQVHDRAAALRAQAAELEEGGGAGPTLALPPGPPPDAGTGPGVGAAA